MSVNTVTIRLTKNISKVALGEYVLECMDRGVYGVLLIDEREGTVSTRTSDHETGRVGNETETNDVGTDSERGSAHG